jgi:hypothetical protein
MDERTGASDREHAIAALRELIAALERRVPQVERVGELRIAHEAAGLKKDAFMRIEELLRTGPHQTHEPQLAEAVMPDDSEPRDDLP